MTNTSPATLRHALLVFAVLSTLVPRSVSAENLLPSGDFEEEIPTRKWAPAHIASQTQEEYVSGGSALRFHLSGWATAPDLIEIDPQKSYVLRISIKEPSAKSNADFLPLTALIGLRFFDENGEPIPPLSVATIPNTSTVLARNAAAGDKVVYLEGTAWEDMPKGGTAIAFGAEEDLSDLPNRKTAGIAEISESEQGFILQLQTPLTASYPAGTRVRQHRYADFPTMEAESSADWTEHVLEIRGTTEPGMVEKDKFWHGVRSVRPSIGVRIRDASSMASEKPIELLIDNVNFTQVE